MRLSSQDQAEAACIAALSAAPSIKVRPPLLSRPDPTIGEPRPRLKHRGVVVITTPHAVDQVECKSVSLESSEEERAVCKQTLDLTR